MKFSDCLYYSSNALSRIMTKMADDSFAQTGLSSSYAFLLMTVNDNPGIQPGAISQQMQLRPSTITRLIEKMEYKGFLERKSVGRKTQVYPTKASLEMDEKVRKAWSGLFDKYARTLGNRKAKALISSIHEAGMKLE